MMSRLAPNAQMLSPPPTTLPKHQTSGCTPCHSVKNSEPMFPVAPNGVMFDTPERIKRMAARIKERAFTTKTMPFLNKTQITEAERAELAKWIDAGAKLQ